MPIGRTYLTESRKTPRACIPEDGRRPAGRISPPALPTLPRSVLFKAGIFPPFGFVPSFGEHARQCDGVRYPGTGPDFGRLTVTQASHISRTNRDSNAGRSRFLARRNLATACCRICSHRRRLIVTTTAASNAGDAITNRDGPRPEPSRRLASTCAGPWLCRWRRTPAPSTPA